MSAAAKYWALIIQRELGTRQAAEYLFQIGVPLREAHDLLIHPLRQPC